MEVSENVRKDLIKYLPASIANQVSCFTFYDSHMRDPRKIDITVCTYKGEVYEFYDRQIISSFFLENVQTIKEIILRRNIEEECKIFYVLVSESEIVILVNENGTLHFRLMVNDVERYEFVNVESVGESCLHVICKDDAVPIIFDSNFNISQPDLVPNNAPLSNSLPILIHMARKLTEARHTVKKNEAILSEYMKLKQTAAFCLYDQGNLNIDDSLFKMEGSSILSTLKIKTKSPVVKICNKKVVVLINIENSSDVPIENLQVLLHGTTKQSLSYQTKVYKEVPSPPYWDEKSFNIMKSNEEHCVVAVLEIHELKYDSLSRIDLEPVFSYRQSGKTYLVPLETVLLTASDVMGDLFDVIINDEEGDKHKILAILATSQRTEIVLTHLKEQNSEEIDINEQLRSYLKFEAVKSMSNILVHNLSPYHILYGLTLVFNNEKIYKHGVGIHVYSRSPAQVLAFINFLYDAVPFRLMATLPDFKITAKSEDMSNYNVNGTENTAQINASSYAKSMLEQSKLLIEYFDKCMIKMNESTDLDVRNKIGQEIHLLSLGLPEYVCFRNKMLKEAARNIEESFVSKLNRNLEDMIIDE